MKKTIKENLVTRPPVVVVLGHIDHGKSSILEAIKDLKITARESGGITQHIGAYEIEEKGKKITFLDTPGHEAFSQMRARGAKVADIAILVVAADEGVKPQTKEAISHIKKAGLSLVIAINKIDKKTADAERVKRELAKEDILVEGSGGKVPSVSVSAYTKEGIEDLLELILLVAEMENFSVDPAKPVEGVIIESYLDSLRGPTATIILTNGTLETGEIIGTISAFGKIKSLEDYQGKKVKKALPSLPAVVFGFGDVPRVGEEIKVFPDLESAKNYVQKIEERTPVVISLEPGQKALNLILKSDVLGTLQALEELLKGISEEKMILRILKSEVGEVNENDIKLAKSAKAIILAFRVKINPIAQILAEREKVRIRQFQIIYELVEEVRKIIEKNVEPEFVKIDLGRAKILAIFRPERNRQVVGGKIIDGKLKKGALVEVLRGEDFIGKGRLTNLQKNKKDVEQVLRGEECGILYEGGGKIEEGDILRFFLEERKNR
ncbi:MAG: translation initiation factor IF-2 [Patescibacteria group bacterium]